MYRPPIGVVSIRITQWQCDEGRDDLLNHAEKAFEINPAKEWVDSKKVLIASNR